VQVRVGSPSGGLLAHTGPSGSATTGKWVGQGTQFFLQDVSGGKPLTSLNTIATVTVNLTTTGAQIVRVQSQLIRIRSRSAMVVDWSHKSFVGLNRNDHGASESGSPAEGC